MEILEFLQEAGTRFGPSGHERELAAWLKTRFAPLCDAVEIDPLFNVLSTLKPNAPCEGGKRAPRVLLCAHQDEIALMVSNLHEDGTLLLGQVGGVDPRILPASMVTVHATGAPAGELTGVIGAKPPHLLRENERDQNYTRNQLFVDLGMSAEEVRRRVNIGDLVTLQGRAVGLLNDRAAGKTMDDRSCIAIMLEAAERLQGRKRKAELVFACTTQEEVGAYGAQVAAHTVAPDLAVVLDVSHAPLPDSKPDTTVPLEAPASTYGPFVQRKLLERLQAAAKAHHIALNLEPSERWTGTDTDTVQVTREGVPCVNICLPLKYMHTTVELLDLNCVRECARLLTEFLAGLDEGWDTDLWN